MADQQQQQQQRADPKTVLLLAKIGAMLILGLGSLALGMLPLIIGRYRLEHRARSASSVSGGGPNHQHQHQHQHQHPEQHHEQRHRDQQSLLTSLLLCFGGGVLLFTTFLHLAPEVRESIERHQADGQLVALEGANLSLSELLFCAGFFLVYFVEEAVHAALAGGPRLSEASERPESSENILYRTVSVRRCCGNAPPAVVLAGTETTTTTTTTTTNNNNNHSSSKNKSVVKVAATAVTSDSSDAEADEGLAAKYHHQHHHHEHHHQQQHPPAQKVHGGGGGSQLRSLLTVLALSFHAIFEGLAVGLEPAFGSVLYLATAIATHKFVISFCVGMELWANSRQSGAGTGARAVLGYLSVFAMVTPLGIGVGLLLGSAGSASIGTTPTVLQAMAAGTLLYVVFFEVLARERANDQSGLLQLASILLGFFLMLALQITTAHSHEHAHSHHDGPAAAAAAAAVSRAGSHHDHDHTTIGSGATAIIEQVTEKIIDALSPTTEKTLT